jgi:hypothetical protein
MDDAHLIGGLPQILSAVSPALGSSASCLKTCELPVQPSIQCLRLVYVWSMPFASLHPQHSVFSFPLLVPRLSRRIGPTMEFTFDLKLKRMWKSRQRRATLSKTT